MRGRGSAPSEKTPSGGVASDGNGAATRPLVSGAHSGGRESALEGVIEIQRARMLAAMVEVSAARGAGNVTVAHVVQRAGVSRRTFYELFSDCEDCFLEAFEDTVGRARRHVLESYDPHARWAERLRGALVAFLSFLDVEPGAGQLLIVGSLGAGPAVLERRRGVLTQTITLVDEGRLEAKTGAQPPPLTAEGIVGGVLSVLHSRLLDCPRPSTTSRSAPNGSPADYSLGGDSLIGLTGPLMGMIVLPYLGAPAARRELAKPTPKTKISARAHGAGGNPLGELEMRLTYRTVRVLIAIAARPGSSNREIADTAEVSDQGQMSKLLARLHGLGLIQNTGGGATRGESNAWILTDEGWRVQGAITEQTPRD
jgi:AcrR family transcriptional regulator/DNA-binding MarR family transcriptional regulator